MPSAIGTILPTVETIVAYLEFYEGHPGRVSGVVKQLWVQREEAEVLQRQDTWEEAGGEKGKGRGKSSRPREVGVKRQLPMVEESPAKRRHMEEDTIDLTDSPG